VTAGGAQAEAALAVIQSAAQEFGWVSDWVQEAAPSAVETAAQSGAAVIVLDGPELERGARAIAGNYPEAYFIGLHPGEGDLPANMLAFGAPRYDQVGFIAGMIAGLTTKTKFVTGIGDPHSAEGLKYLNGFAHGVRYACPKCRIEGIDVTIQSSPTGQTAVVYAISGCDVFFAAPGAAGKEALVAAAQEGAWVIGSDRDTPLTLFGGQAPEAEKVLTSVYLAPGAALRSALAAFQAGAPPKGRQPLSASTGAIRLAPYNAPLEVFSALDRQVIATALGRLADGSLDTGIDPATGEEK